MSIIFDEQFISMVDEGSESLMTHKWKAKTSEMTDEQYREIAIKQVEMLTKHKPKNWVVDMADLRFTVVPKTQEWADTELFPQIIAAGIKRIAFVISPDIFSQISVEQLMNEKNVKTADFEIKYFDSEDKARNWVLN